MKYILALEGIYYLYNNSFRKIYICMFFEFLKFGVLEFLVSFFFYFIIIEDFRELRGFEIFILYECM